MIFSVLPWGSPIPRKSKDPMVVLIRDNWNDYGFLTTFHATIVAESGALELGSVKILHLNQESGATPIGSSFTQLSEEYCSLGQAMSYYETLKSLGDELCDQVLRDLRDVVRDGAILAEFEHMQGFQKSLIRVSSAERVLIDGPVFLRSTGAWHPDETEDQVAVEFVTTVGGNRFQFNMNFRSGGRIPGRVTALIGYNGSGKTRLLANIAMLTATPQQDREDPDFIAKYGQMVRRFSFGGTFAVSFSAFDDFELPGRNAQERRQVSDRREEYIYCGLRRLRSDDIEDTILSESDRQVRLKSSREIIESFEQALRKIQTSDRRKAFVESLTILSMEPSFSRLNLLSALTQSDDEPLQFFKYLSTGHKIVVNVITQMAAHLQKKSLVLFDEPECHLHPPLLAALLKALRLILERTDSFCLLATHSPVVLQETPRTFVQIIRRNGPKTHIVPPQIETFGENVGTLTHEVFNLDSSKNDFHDVLSMLAMDKKLPEIEALFGGPLGFQARSYLFSLGVKQS
jgi:predicted ATPase